MSMTQQMLPVSFRNRMQGSEPAHQPGKGRTVACERRSMRSAAPIPICRGRLALILSWSPTISATGLEAEILNGGDHGNGRPFTSKVYTPLTFFCCYHFFQHGAYYLLQNIILDCHKIRTTPWDDLLYLDEQDFALPNTATSSEPHVHV